MQTGIFLTSEIDPLTGMPLYSGVRWGAFAINPGRSWAGDHAVVTLATVASDQSDARIEAFRLFCARLSEVATEVTEVT